MGQEVTPSGAFSYRYPIELPPGTNGMAPKLALVYNSQAGNVIIGMGWSLEGLSVISRDPSYPITFNDSTDHFLLDGQKLIKGPNGYYHTEKESYLRIQAFDLGGASSRWEVTAKDGTKRYYGDSADSRIDAVGQGGRPRLWALTKTQDIHSNYIEVQYAEDTDNGDYYPQQITYTRHDATPAISVYRTVEFFYTPRDDHEVMLLPTPVDADKRLRCISVKVSEAQQSVYWLDYEVSPNSFRSRLTRISRYGTDCPPPTSAVGGFPWLDSSYAPSGTLPLQQSFTWQNGGSDTESLYNGAGDFMGGAGASIYPGDFNGDGKTDMLMHMEEGGIGYNYLLYADAQGRISCDYGPADFFGCVGASFYCGDFNGDGRTDLFAHMEQSSGNYNITLLANGQGSFAFNGAGDFIGFAHARFYPGDYNGDGKTDLFAHMEQSSGNYNITLVKSGPRPDLIIECQNEYRGTTQISYTSAVQLPEAVLAAGKSYPLTAKSSPSPLVTQISYQDGRGASVTSHYQYYNGICQTGYPYDRADLGYEWVNKTDAANAYTLTYYDQRDSCYAGLVRSLQQFGNDGVLYQEVEHGYFNKTVITADAATHSHAAKFIFPTDTATRIYDAGTPGDPVIYRQQFYDGADPEGTWYDAYGNQLKVKNFGDTSVVTDDSEEDYSYAYLVDAAHYRIGISSVKRYGYALNSTWGLASKIRTYYYADGVRSLGGTVLAAGQMSANGPVAKVERENGTVDPAVQYGYDAYGNVTHVKDGRGNVNETVYDTSYQTWPAGVKNALETHRNDMGYTTYYDYDSIMRVERVRDVNRKDWWTYYDAFSRVTATVAPGDSEAAPTTRTTYSDIAAPSDFPRWVKQEQKDSTSEASPATYLQSITYYDGLGRVIQTKREAEIAGQWITENTHYDAAGRVAKTDVPYLSSGAAFDEAGYEASRPTTVTAYDAIGRVASVTHPDGTQSRTVYEKRATLTIDPNGHVSCREVTGAEQKEQKYTGEYPSQALYATVTTLKARDGVRISDPAGNLTEIRVDMLGQKTRYTDPNMTAAWTYAYDANGNLTSQTDAAGKTVLMEYDALNRLIKKDYPNMTDAVYTYDVGGAAACALGRLTGITFAGGSESRAYDARGRVISHSRTIQGISRTMQTTYDAADRIARQTYPGSGAEEVSYTYNPSGALETLTGASSYITAIHYLPLGKVSEMLFGNQVRTVYDYYDSTGEQDNTAGTSLSYRLKGIAISQGATPIANTTYQYDPKDNVRVKDFSDGTLYYYEDLRYDELDRLDTASCAQLYGWKDYNYNTLGNITLKDGRTYSYALSGRPYWLSADGRTTYTLSDYDANGRLLKLADSKRMSYDEAGRVSGLSDGTIYGYDDIGERTYQTVGAKTIYYFFPNYEEERTTGQPVNEVSYYFANGQRVAKRSTTEGLRYIHTDHLGSAVRLTNTSGTVVQSLAYDPFGAQVYAAGSGNTRYRFTDQELDVSGLYYYGARYYDPALGRFLQADTVLDGLNRYAYCRNNPVKYVDPTGHDPHELQTPDGEGIPYEPPDVDREAYHNGRDNKDKNNGDGKKNSPISGVGPIVSIDNDGVFVGIGVGTPEGVIDGIGVGIHSDDEETGIGVGTFKGWKDRPSSSALTRALEKVFGKKPLNYEAHHVVTGYDRRAKEARRILEKNNVGINEADNGVFLPAGVHRHINTNEYHRQVTDRLRSANQFGPQYVRDTLLDIAGELAKGIFPY